MDWPNETILEFLEHYKTETVIWDSFSPLHKNRDFVYDAWTCIEQKMNHKFSIKELKKKKDSLMVSFRACKQKIKSSVKSGSGSDELYTPSWFAYKPMESFLSDKNRPRATINTEDMVFEDTDNVVGMPEPVELEESGLDNEALVLPSNSGSEPRKKRKINEVEEIKTQMKQAYSMLKRVSERPPKEKDVSLAFAEFVGTELQAMEEERRDYVMHHIHNLIYESKKMFVPNGGHGSAEHSRDHDYTNVADYVTISYAGE